MDPSIPRSERKVQSKEKSIPRYADSNFQSGLEGDFDALGNFEALDASEALGRSEFESLWWKRFGIFEAPTLGDFEALGDWQTQEALCRVERSARARRGSTVS